MRQLSWWVLSVWILAFALLVLNAAVALFNMDALRRNDNLVSDAREIQNGLVVLSSELADAQTATRGYVISGQPAFLEPHRRAEAILDERLQRLRALTVGTDDRINSIDRLEKLVREKYRVMDAMIAARRGPDGEARARDMVVRGIGQAAINEVRAEVAILTQQTDELVAERTGAAQSGYRSAGYATVVGSAMTIAVSAMAFALVRRELFARRLAETEARQAAANLESSQRATADTLSLLDAFLANVPVGIAFFDSNLKYLRVNEHLAVTNARPATEHVGRDLLEVVPDMPVDVVRDLRSVADNGQPLLNREVVGRPGGENRIWLSSYFPVRAPDGRTLGVGLITQDVTERVAIEHRLRDSEARKAAILEAALDCVISIDLAGNLLEFNPAAERTFGYRRSDVEGQDFVSLILPHVRRHSIDRGLDQFLATAEGPALNRRIEQAARRKDGSEFPCEFAVTAISVAGRPIFTMYLRDITDRKRGEIALRHSLEQFRILVEAIPQLVCVTDPLGMVIQANGRWTEFTGLTESTQSDWLSAVHPEDAAATEAAWTHALESAPEILAHECRIRSVDRDFRWMLVAAVPLQSETGAVTQWVVTFTDIDDQKRQSDILSALVKMRTTELEGANQLLRDEISERTRAESRAQAAAVELGRSNEDLEKFAYVASHDLQEPLRKIQAFGDRLTKKYRDVLGPDGQEYVDRMQFAAKRMRTLIDDLLSFSRVTSRGQAFSSIDLSEVAADVLADLELQVSQTGGRVEVGNLPTLEADPFQMRQLFQNLIGNALKFHKPNVPPVVQIESTPWVDLGPEEVPHPPKGVGYRITVSDNGIGLDPAYADRIFQVFQRLHGREEYQGTGIGLAICRKIAQRHGGDIAVRSRPGEGAVFIIDLPARAG